MSTLRSLLERIESPSRIGFLIATAIYLIAGTAFVTIGESIKPKSEGKQRVTLTLASIISEPIPKPKQPHTKSKVPQPSRPQEFASARRIAPQEPMSDPIAQSKNTQEQRDESLKHNEGVSDAFLSQIHALISLHNPYPRMARIRKMEGKVMLEFILDIDGSIDGLRILSSTASDLLNKSAILALRKASKKFPTPKQKVKIKVPIVYSLS